MPAESRDNRDVLAGWSFEHSSLQVINSFCKVVVKGLSLFYRP